MQHLSTLRLPTLQLPYSNQPGISPEGEIPRRRPSNSRIYIEKCLQLKYAVSIPDKTLDLLKTGTAWTLRVMMTFQRWKPACIKWLGWWNFTENARRDRLGWFGLCSHTAMKLRVFSDILWSSCLEDYDIKTETRISYTFRSHFAFLNKRHKFSANVR